MPYLEDRVMKDRFNGLLQRLAIDWSQLVWINSESNSMIFCLQQCIGTSVCVLTSLDCMLQICSGIECMGCLDACLGALPLTLMLSVTNEYQADQTGLTDAMPSCKSRQWLG